MSHVYGDSDEETMEEVKSVLKKADKNTDGNIDYKEFVKFMKTMYE